jgi:hypothetical protein
MTAKSNRQALIEKIMTVEYGSDNPKNDSQNRAFLESLTTAELEKKVYALDHEEIEDEFELEGEVRDIDFDESELS